MCQAFNGHRLFDIRVDQYSFSSFKVGHALIAYGPVCVALGAACRPTSCATFVKFIALL